jgi:endonuclease III
MISNYENFKEKKEIMIQKIYSILEKEIKKYDAPVAELVKAQTNDPFKILIATILSARTKDETTAKVCNNLFKKIKNLNDLKKINEDDLAKLLFPVGFYKTKAKHLKKLAVLLETDFGSNVPQSIEELILLPGVGRKTANLVLSVAFNKPAICVDVHVNRILNRIGYIKTKNPLETEMVLRKKLPKKLWMKTNRIFVPYGQMLCKPINPLCSKCKIYDYCERNGVKKIK